jgi:NAD(P)-dependent dehydrogenase (short-subunit alcohol dehydrogenase family)
MFDLKDKVCLVTGGAGSIGLGFVKGFLQRGAKCLMVDINHRVLL